MERRQSKKEVKMKEVKMKEKAVIVDVDGTLFEEVPNWTPETDLEWVEKTLQMPELTTGIELMRFFSEVGFKIVILTARGQTCKVNTWIRFREAGIDKIVDGMYHRPNYWVNLPPVQYKRNMMKRIMNRYDVRFALDDSDKNLAMFAEFGIATFDAKKWWH